MNKKKDNSAKKAKSAENSQKKSDKVKKIGKKEYKKELAKLQVELVKLQRWVQHKGLKVIVLFEGRDAAGKGGSIKRVSETLNPRICKVVALGNTERSRKNAVVFSKIRGAFSRSRRNCLIRSQLV